MGKSEQQQYAAKVGAFNREFAEKIYKLLEGNPHYQPLVKFMRDQYDHTLQFFYDECRSDEYQFIEKKIFSEYLEVSCKVLGHLELIACEIDPIAYYKVFPPNTEITLEDVLRANPGFLERMMENPGTGKLL